MKRILLSIILALMFVLPVQAADTKISALTDGASGVATTDILPIVRGGANYRVTFGDLIGLKIGTLTNGNHCTTDGTKVNCNTDSATTFSNIKQSATEAATGVVELATDGETQTGTATDKAITPANLSARTATETRTGIAELATVTEVIAGTDTARTVTPAGLAGAMAVQTNPKAMAQGVHTIASTSVYGLQITDSPHIDPGTGNYSIFWLGKTSDYSPSTTQYLMYKATGGNGWGLNINSTSAKIGLVHAGTGTTHLSSVGNTLIDNTPHMIGVVVTREAEGVAGTAKFYIDKDQLGSDVAITAGAPTDINTSANLFIMGDGASKMVDGDTYLVLFFNRALTASEVLDLYRHGVAFADKWGSQTNKLSGDSVNFEGNTVGNWTATVAGGTLAVNSTTPITGTYDLKIDSGGQYFGGCVPIGTITEGKKYRVGFKYRSPSGSWYTKMTTSNNYGGVTVGMGSNALTIDGATNTFEIEFVATTTTANGYLHIGDIVNETKTIHIDDVSVVQVGATLALESEGIQTDKWYDSSSNGLNATYPASGSSLTRTKNGNIDRVLGLNIEPGATPNTNINITYLVALSWNAPLTSDATNLAASGTSGSFSLSADGKTITYAITPNILAINSITIVRSKLNTASATTYYVYPGLSSGDLLLQIEPHGTPGVVDWRTILDSGDVLRIFISMKTDS